MTLLVLLTVMDYFRMVYNHDLCYHTRSSILYSYATWFNEGRATFLRTPGVQAKLRDIVLVLHYVIIKLNMLLLSMDTSQTRVIRISDRSNLYNPMTSECMAVIPMILLCSSVLKRPSIVAV